MAINGADVLLYVNTGTTAVPAYTLVGSQRDVTFDESTDEIDVSNKDSRAKRVLPGRYSASVSLDALYIVDDEAYLALRDANRDGDLILIERVEANGRDETATALVTDISEALPDQGEGTISVSLTIDGTWTEVGS